MFEGHFGLLVKALYMSLSNTKLLDGGSLTEEVTVKMIPEGCY